MGVQGLFKLISEKSPKSIKEQELKNFFGRRIAIDASMSIYQFLIAMKGAFGGEGELANEAGEVTSHLQGMLNRTVKMVGQGIRPIYVFDGAPPQIKRDTLAGRNVRAAEAAEKIEELKEEGDKEELIRQQKRSVRATKEQTEECKRLLTLMGIPVVQAKSEAEATCAALVRAGKCWATGTEDMDVLTFGTPIMVRHLTYSDAKKQPIVEIDLQKVLEGLELTMEMFIDLCILLGCDYCSRIPGIGPHKAYEGIVRHKTIEAFLAALDRTKYKVPEFYPFEEARKFFRNPEITAPDDPSVDLTYKDPDEEALKQFLVTEKNFSEEKVTKVAQQLRQARRQKTQGRLDGFFQVVASAAPAKRKADEANAKLPAAKKPKVPAKSTGKRAVTSNPGKK